MPSTTVSTAQPDTRAENLTREQFTGVAKRRHGVLSASRDTLNPLLNTETLKNRLAVIEHYKYRHGVEHAHWPHFAMKRLFNHVNKFKVNYAVKGFAAYLVYRDVAQWQHMRSRAFLTYEAEAMQVGTTMAHTGLFLGICALI